MMKNGIASNFRAALAAAAVRCPAEPGNDPMHIAHYLKSVLDTVLTDTGIEVEVIPIPYHTSSKVPVLILLSKRDPRLLWYHRGISVSALSDELFWLLSDHPLIAGRIPA